MYIIIHLLVFVGTIYNIVVIARFLKLKIFLAVVLQHCWQALYAVACFIYLSCCTVEDDTHGNCCVFESHL